VRKITPQPAIFRHSSHEEWGHGIIVEENPSKVYLSFENGGWRVFSNHPKYRQLLLRVELPSEKADALVAKIQKSAKPLPKKAAVKKKAAAPKAPKAPAAKKRAEDASDHSAESLDYDLDADE